MRTHFASVPPALVSHPLLQDADLQRTRHMVTDVINPHSLSLRDDPPRLAARLYAADVGAVTLSYLHYRTAVEISALDVASCYCVQFPLAGTAEVRCGDATLRSSRAVASVPPPVDPLRMSWSADAAHLIVRVDAGAVHDHLEALLGRPLSEPLRPRLGLALRGATLARWRSLLELLQAEIAASDHLPSGPAVRNASGAAVEELVLNALLLWHPNNHWESLAQGRRPAAAPYVRRAVEYAQEHLAEALTVARLAEVACVSVRALQEGFRRELGCSPSRYVREQRLARVREELLAGDPAEVQVTAVAYRWGFSHLGRFAAVYQERFGERPSATLARR